MRMTRLPTGYDWKNKMFSTGTVTLAASSGAGVLGAVNKVSLKLDYKGFTLIYKLIATSTSRFSSLLSQGGKAYSNTTVRDDNLYGTAQYPFRLPAPIIVTPGTPLKLDLYDESGSTNTVKIAMDCVVAYNTREVERLARMLSNGVEGEAATEFYQLVARRSYTASSRLPLSVKADADYPFHVQSIVGWATGAYNLSISDNGDDRSAWDDQPIPNVNYVGTAQLPHDIHPRILPPQTTVKYDIEDTTGSTNVVELALTGFKQPYPKRS